MSEAAKPAWPPAPPVVTPRRVIAFVGMVFGMFMAILDIQIVSASLAEIQAGLSASAEEISWVQTAYLIAEVVMIPLSGFLGRMISTRYLFAASAFGFTLMSVMCAQASSIEEMIIWRALQGFIGDAGTDHRTNDWWLFDRYFFLALALPCQRRARHFSDAFCVVPNRF